MNDKDPILARYRKTNQQLEDEKAAKLATDEKERLRLLASLTSEIDRAFDRLEDSDYADEVVKGIIRTVKTDSEGSIELVTWPLDNDRFGYGGVEADFAEYWFLGSDRSLLRSVQVARVHNPPLEPLQEMLKLSLEKLQRIVNGLQRVGTRR